MSYVGNMDGVCGSDYYLTSCATSEMRADIVMHR